MRLPRRCLNNTGLVKISRCAAVPPSAEAGAGFAGLFADMTSTPRTTYRSCRWLGDHRAAPRWPPGTPRQAVADHASWSSWHGAAEPEVLGAAARAFRRRELKLVGGRELTAVDHSTTERSGLFRTDFLAAPSGRPSFVVIGSAERRLRRCSFGPADAQHHPSRELAVVSADDDQRPRLRARR